MGGSNPLVLSLAKTLDPVRMWFNEYVGHARIVAIQSVTRLLCVRGARGALEQLFTDLPDGIDMMPTDDLAAVAEVGARVADPRLTMFHDAKHRLGPSMARCLGWKHHLAWDTYLLYAAGRTWNGADPPVPDEWFHQLKDREVWEETAEAELGSKEWTQCLPETCEADEAKFRTGDELRQAMTAAIRRLASD